MTQYSTMAPDTQQGVWHELMHLVEDKGWTVTSHANHFEMTPPTELLADLPMLRNEVWHIAGFVGYSPLTSVEQTSTGGYIITSRRSAEQGFTILINKP
jgi:hypothetical protein